MPRHYTGNIRCKMYTINISLPSNFLNDCTLAPYQTDFDNRQHPLTTIYCVHHRARFNAGFTQISRESKPQQIAIEGKKEVEQGLIRSLLLIAQSDQSGHCRSAPARWPLEKARGAGLPSCGAPLAIGEKLGTLL